MNWAGDFEFLPWGAKIIVAGKRQNEMAGIPPITLISNLLICDKFDMLDFSVCF